MLRPFGPGFTSDAIAHRYGFEGNEPEETRRFYREYAALGIRSSFAVNTYYPEIRGGYYVNRALFVLLSRAIEANSMLSVIADVWRPDGLVPVEAAGQFNLKEEYALVTPDQKRIGALQVWQFDAAGGGAYYADNIIFDLILREDTTERVVEEVESSCRAASVRFRRTNGKARITGLRQASSRKENDM